MTFFEKLKKRKTEISFFLALAFFLLWLHGNSFQAPFFRDEGEYAYSAWLMREGVAPYENSFLQKPPMIIYTYGLAQLINSEATWPPRFLAGLFVFLSAFLIFRITKREFGQAAAFFAAGIFPLLAVLPKFDQFGANTEIFLLSPLLGVLDLYFLKREKASLWHWFWAGFFSGITFFYKYNILPLLVFVFLFWILSSWKKNQEIKTGLRKIIVALSGGLSAAILILAYFLLTDSWKNLWDATVVFNLAYSGSEIFSGAALGSNLKLFWQAWWPLGILGIFFFIFPPKNWLVYLVFFLLAVFYSWGSWYGHYYLVLTPFLAMMAGYSFSLLSKKISQVFFLENQQKKTAINLRGLRIAFFTVIFLIIIFPLIPIISLSPKEFNQEKLSQGGPFLESQFLAEKISQLTLPEDFVLVAGSEPQILFYAKRKNASRFDIVYPLTLDTPLAEKYQKQAIKEIKVKKPQVIVFVNNYYSWTPNSKTPRIFSEFLEKLIQEEYEFLGGLVKEEKKPAVWRSAQELENKELSESMLLYKQKSEKFL